jgi:hypothetical protein
MEQSLLPKRQLASENDAEMMRDRTRKQKPVFQERAAVQALCWPVDTAGRIVDTGVFAASFAPAISKMPQGPPPAGSTTAARECLIELRIR